VRTYTTGDRLRIAIKGGVVKYYKNTAPAWREDSRPSMATFQIDG
jgi:hypothetical protein